MTTAFHQIEEAVTFTQIARKMKVDRRTLMSMITDEQWAYFQKEYNYIRGKNRKIPSGMVAYLYAHVIKVKP